MASQLISLVNTKWKEGASPLEIGVFLNKQKTKYRSAINDAAYAHLIKLVRAEIPSDLQWVDIDYICSIAFDTSLRDGCPNVKVRNPKSKRCVKLNGAIGRDVLLNSVKSKSKAKPKSEKTRGDTSNVYRMTPGEAWASRPLPPSASEFVDAPEAKDIESDIDADVFVDAPEAKDIESEFVDAPETKDVEPTIDVIESIDISPFTANVDVIEFTTEPKKPDVIMSDEAIEAEVHQVVQRVKARGGYVEMIISYISSTLRTLVGSFIDDENWYVIVTMCVQVMAESLSDDYLLLKYAIRPLLASKRGYSIIFGQNLLYYVNRAMKARQGQSNRFITRFYKYFNMTYVLWIIIRIAAYFLDKSDFEKWNVDRLRPRGA